jgi:formate/nitrite transporter
MAFKDPQAITDTGTEKGAAKAKLSWDKALVAGFLAGAYIAFAGLLAIIVSSGMKPEIWGTFPTLITGAAFSLGLILVVIAGSELLTGNMALVPLAAFRNKVSMGQLMHNLAFVLIGNLLGALFVAYFLADQTGVLAKELPMARITEIATLKGNTESSWQIFLRAVGCNWLVCLAVWMAFAAEDVGGKILAIFFPIMAFVALGFDHVVANFFFLPVAIFVGVDGVSWGDAIHNWIFAFLGNFVGAALFVAGAYWYLYAKDEDEGKAEAKPGDEPAASGTSGRFTTNVAEAAGTPQGGNGAGDVEHAAPTTGR